MNHGLDCELPRSITDSSPSNASPSSSRSSAQPPHSRIHPRNRPRPSIILVGSSAPPGLLPQLVPFSLSPPPQAKLACATRRNFSSSTIPPVSWKFPLPTPSFLYPHLATAPSTEFAISKQESPTPQHPSIGLFANPSAAPQLASLAPPSATQGPSHARAAPTLNQTTSTRDQAGPTPDSARARIRFGHVHALTPSPRTGRAPQFVLACSPPSSSIAPQYTCLAATIRRPPPTFYRPSVPRTNGFPPHY